MVAPLYEISSSGRGLMASLWRQSLAAYVSGNPQYGVRISDDFTTPIVANTTDASLTAAGFQWWLQDSAAGGTSESLVSGTNADGHAILSATTGTDHFGISMHYGTTAVTQGVVALPTHATAAARRGRVVFQTRVDLGTLDTFFIGLTEPIVDFLSSVSALPTTSDYIGFYRYDDGALTFVTANDNNGGTAVIDSATILTAAEMATAEAITTFMNIGFAVNKDGSVDIVVNGKWYGSAGKSISSLALPIEYLTPKYETTRGPTGDKATVSLTIDDIHVFIEAA